MPIPIAFPRSLATRFSAVGLLAVPVFSSGGFEPTAEEHAEALVRRDEPYAAPWLVTHSAKACEGNAEAITPHQAVAATTLLDCQRECEGLWGCMGVDYYRETKVCNLYRNACVTPSADHDGASSYRIKRSVVWETISEKAACKGSVDLFKEKGHVASLELCKRLCENRASCLAVDYYPVTQVCQMYQEACTSPSFVQDGSQSYRIARGLNWLLTDEGKGCESNNDRVVFKQKKHMPNAKLDDCKKWCEHRSDCRAVDWYAETSWCVLYDDACTHPLSTADGVQSWRVQREGLPKVQGNKKLGLMRREDASAAAAAEDAGTQAASSLWSTIDAQNACQASKEGVQHFKEFKGDDGGFALRDCQQLCENNGRCTAIDFYRTTRYCLLYEQACTEPSANHDGASSMRIVRSDLASVKSEFGTAIAIAPAAGMEVEGERREVLPAKDVEYMAREGSADDKVVATVPQPPLEKSAAERVAAIASDWHGKMKQALKSLDKEGTGFVSVEHIREAMSASPKNIGESKLNSILSEVAVNGDGKVDYEDFLGLFKMGLTV
eukprot:TRINITY_DN7158_c0_g1_i1.p2 TRINITY_DN7158_c0_g1~~TRINITY_DN7158_c0_g1_i1.p2  ORF type:complete len:579 (+),score=178.56 TRINITY_DN7158_c0_g1_i1:82-1737(+)